MVDLDWRKVGRAREQVLGERRRLRLSGLVVHVQLEQREAHALSDAAPDLALDDHRVDHRAAILDDDDPLDRHAAGAAVNLDHCGNRPVGVSGARGVEECRRGQRGVAELGADVRGEVGRPGDRRERNPPRRGAADADRAVDQLEVFVRGLEQDLGHPQQLVAAS